MRNLGVKNEEWFGETLAQQGEVAKTKAGRAFNYPRCSIPVSNNNQITGFPLPPCMGTD
jgi:hypothetical protein